MTAYRVIDADAHFVEPPEVWNKYLDPKFRHAAPKKVIDNQGRSRRVIANHMMEYIPNAPPPPGGVTMDKKPGSFDPKARIADMDEAGVDTMVIYPTSGLYFFSLKDVPTCVALCQAYNNWASDFVKYDPKRLVAPCIIPQIDVDEAIKEARRGLGELGLRGVFMRPNPVGGRTMDHPAYEPLWDVLEEYNAPVVLHEGTTQDLNQTGMDRYDNFMFRHMISHPFEQQMALLSMICGGVLERHPKLRTMTVECGVAWAPYWIDRMDDHIHHWGHASLKLPLMPSEYFRRQCFVAAEGNERLLPFTVDAIGDDNICFSTDYPHPDHPFDGVVEGLKTMNGLSDVSKRKILGENAARLFGI